VGDQPSTAQWALLSTSANLAGRCATLAAWFFLTPLILRHLGASGFGLWAIIGALVGYLGLFEAGIGTAVARLVAVHHSRNNMSGMQVAAASGFRLTLLLATGCLVATFIAAVVISSLFGERYWTISLLAGAGVAMRLPATVPIVVLRGLGRFDLASMVGIVGTVIFAGAVVAVMELGYGLTGLVAVDAPVTLATSIVTVAVLRRVDPQMRLINGPAERAVMRELFGYGLPLLFANASEQVNAQSDELIIAALRSVEDVTPYTLARRLSELPRTFAEPFVRVILPRAAAATGDVARQRAVYITTTRVTGGLLGVTACALGPLAGPFLAAWTGRELPNAHVIAWLLIAAVVIDTSLWPLGILLQGIGRHRILPLVSAGALVLNLSLSLLLIGPLGADGVALATLTVAVAVNAALIPLAARLVGFHHLDTARALLPAFVAAIPATATAIVLTRVLEPQTIVTVVAVGVVPALLFTTVYLLLPPAREERELVRALVGRLTR
jgi:O-antigen/teichoic acid export membrane protein